MGLTKKQIEYVVTELVGEEALPFVFYIKGKALIERQIVGPIVGTWLSNVIVLLLGSFLIYKHANSR